jgi:hypothetical protein
VESCAQSELPLTEIIERSGKPPLEGEDVMEFRLLYQGILTANGSVADKFAIRRQFHPQLRNLCSEHPILRSQFVAWGSHDAQQALGESYTAEGAFQFGIRRYADTRMNGFCFLPLSKKEWQLRCSLDVVFLRREKPSRVFMRGDIDNRFKTLFDALQMPQNGQEIGSEVPQSDEDPFFVLLQEDDLIADVSLTTDRLLDIPFARQYDRDYSVLVINVKLQPTHRSAWFHVFS